MRLLLDTHILLWWFSNDPALPGYARTAIADSGAEVFVSAASTWEISIKQALGRLSFPTAQLPTLIKNERMATLAISVEHSLRAGGLPPHHRDPFDRMLIAQAQHDGLTIVTVDPQIRHYAVAVLDT